jgi:hypothetical protein
VSAVGEERKSGRQQSSGSLHHLESVRNQAEIARADVGSYTGVFKLAEAFKPEAAYHLGAILARRVTAIRRLAFSLGKRNGYVMASSSIVGSVVHPVGCAALRRTDLRRLTSKWEGAISRFYCEGKAIPLRPGARLSHFATPYLFPATTRLWLMRSCCAKPLSMGY